MIQPYSSAQNKKLAQELLNWFSLNARQMPWRVVGGAHFNPYYVWISEIMLQQTTVKTVESYFLRWIERFPDIQSLASADLKDVLLMWQGLGYYTRARKIYECAQTLCQKYQGKLPQNREELLKLPGIGPYSASSICAFAFNQPETVVDGNVIRVIARLYGITNPVSKEEIYQLAQLITPPTQGADYASAIMDLGATVCTPVKADCPLCPWKKHCQAYQQNLVEQIPVIHKPQKKIKTGAVYLIQNQQGSYYIQKRTKKGLLSGLYEFPWQEDDTPPFQASWQTKNQTVTHTFTHFKLTLKLFYVKEDNPAIFDGIFVKKEDFKNYPFSTLMKKVIQKCES